MALNNIDITNENTDVFCLKSSQDSSSEEYEKILGKYPYLQVVPTTVFSKYDYLLKNGLLKYKNNNFEFIEIITRCNRKYIFPAQSLSDIKFNQFVVLFTDSDTELGRVTDFLDNIENMNDHRKGIESGVAILRIASDNDLRFFNQKYQDEIKAKEETIKLVTSFNFDMKITETRWQSDRQRLTIYFTAPHRIDFRELVKDMAKCFKTRIELRQISAREEAKRLGSFLGPCGRDMCCTSFLNNFEHITLDHARIQQLSHNLTKLTGNCGRLKCCLKYEYDVYSKIAEKIVPVGTLIYLDDKILKVKKLDIPNENAVVTNETDNTTTITNFNDLKSFLNSGTVVKPSNYCDSNKDEIVDLSEIEG